MAFGKRGKGVDKLVFKNPGAPDGESALWENFFPKYFHCVEHEKLFVNCGLPDVTIWPAHGFIVVVRGNSEVVFRRRWASAFRTPNGDESQFVLINAGQ